MKNKKVKNYYFEDEYDDKLIKIMNFRNLKSKSEALRNSVDETLSIIEIETKLQSLILEINDIKKITIETLQLLKQFYSDMEIETLTDVKKSETLNTYYKRKRE